jgi:DNA sulfur modification protein DndD
MILRHLTLQDFGLYAGINELDLVPRKPAGRSLPIVLIGGKNGAGKTTLLEAVRLALYGRRALGARVGQSEYEAYLQSRINRFAVSRSASVMLEFDYAEAGIVHRYLVRREWAVRGKNVVEALILEKDGAVINSVPREEWQHFLQELIPPGVSQLFFFDGEKISEIAGSDDEDEQLGIAVRGLLGIDLVSQLRIDLGLFLARHRGGEDSDIAARLEAVIRDVAVTERAAAELFEKVAELSAQRDSQARNAERVRRQFVAEGGDAALHRTQTEGQREQVRRAIHQTEQELREAANKLLPFAMAPRLLASFGNALAAANGGQLPMDMLAAFRRELDLWRTGEQPVRSAMWDAAHWADLEAFLRAKSTSADRLTTSPAFREIGDGATAIARLNEVNAVVRPQAATLLDEMDALAEQARELDTILSRADNAAAGVMLDEVLLAERALGSTEASLRIREEELKALRGQINMLERERNRLLDAQASSAKTTDRAALAARTAQALAQYEQRLLHQKLAQLQDEFVGCFNRLVRKESLVISVKIDPETFGAMLIGRDGKQIPKSSLSAGEKQIYATAMLWALARTSGRSLPMIIDTPLARLDSEHRAKLVERYFPAASHQVILLSTDTEIDERLYNQLAPDVSHSYRLEYDQESGRTSMMHGYFDDGAAERRPVHALQQA